MKSPKLKMVEKGGKKVPAFAADGVGKMAIGGVIGALMNKDKPGGMLAGAIPGVPGMLLRGNQREQEALMLAEKKAKEEAAARGRVQKKATGGMCRGMGAATKGGNYKG